MGIVGLTVFTMYTAGYLFCVYALGFSLLNRRLWNSPPIVPFTVGAAAVSILAVTYNFFMPIGGLFRVAIALLGLGAWLIRVRPWTRISHLSSNNRLS
jgi:hypothetical protein